MGEDDENDNEDDDDEDGEDMYGKELLEEMDTNGDGKISWAECLAQAKTAEQDQGSAYEKNMLEKLFLRADKDKSKFLEGDEIGEMLVSIGEADQVGAHEDGN